MGKYCIFLLVAVTMAFAAEPPLPASGPTQAGNRLPDELPDFVREQVQQASDQAKPILLDFGASWCGPCRLMDKQVLPHPVVAAELDNWILIKVDRDRYPQLAESLRIHGLPAYLTVENGLVTSKAFGYQIPHDFAEWLAGARGN